MRQKARLSLAATNQTATASWSSSVTLWYFCRTYSAAGCLLELLSVQRLDTDTQVASKSSTNGEELNTSSKKH